MLKNEMLSWCHRGVCCLALLTAISAANAEVLVILPETGAMARAGLSIKQGIISANQVSGVNTTYKFVNSNGQSIATLFKNNVNTKTEMVIGPLARQDVETLLKLNPKLPVLALNEVESTHKNVWQYSLSKDADAEALSQELQKDKISTLYVYRQAEKEADSDTFLSLVEQKFRGTLQVVEHIPKKIDSKSGVLLLGNNQWINSIEKLPKKNIYAQAIAIGDNQPVPLGLKFCDVPAIYVAKWPDVIQAYQNQPTSMPYQRLIAFGGDAWELSQAMLSEKPLKNLSFAGRTGKINMLDQRIQRTPSCFVKTKKGLMVA